MADKTVQVTLKANIAQYKRSMAEAKGSTDNFSKGSARNLQQLGTSMQNVGRTATLGLTVPLAGIAGASIKMAAGFETSMSKIVGLVGLSTEEVDGMKDAVLGLSGETARSPQELADALFVVTSAGLRGADAMDALEFAAKAGAAGLGETKDIARAVAGAMNAYGPEVLDAAKATDILTATARAGNFETSQLAGSLGKVLPFAKEAQVSFEDVGGAIALMTRVNGNASESITNTTSLLKAFVTPTQQTKTELDKLGLSAEDVRKSMGEQGLAATLDMLYGMTGNNVEAFGKLIGTAEGTGGALAIVNADAQTIADTFGVTADAVGMTSEAFGAAADTDAFKMQQALNDLKVAMVDLGTVLLPIAAQIAGAIGSAASAFSELDPVLQKVVIGIGGVAAAAGPLLIVTGKLITAWSTLKTTMAGGRLATLAGTSLIGPLGVLAGAIAVVGSAWYRLGEDERRIEERTERVKAAMDARRQAAQDLADALVAGTDPMAVFRTELSDMAVESDVMRGAMAEAGLTIDDLAERAAGGQQLWRTLTDAAEAAGFSKEQIDELHRSVGQFDTSSRSALEIWKQIAPTADEAAEATEEQTTATYSQAEGYAILEAATAEADQAAKDHIATVEEEADKLEALAEMFEEQANAMRSAADAQFALRDAEDSHINALAELKTAMEKTPKDLRAIQQAQDRVAESARDVAEAHVRMADETAAAEGKVLSATERLDIMNESLLDQAAAAKGPAREAIINYIADLNGIPPKKAAEILTLVNEDKLKKADDKIKHTSRNRELTIKADADTTAADAKLADLTATRTMSIVANIVGGASSQIGSIIRSASGRASGGPTMAGSFYEVTERGSELLTEGGRTYLMTGSDGYVTPLDQVTPSTTSTTFDPKALTEAIRAGFPRTMILDVDGRQMTAHVRGVIGERESELAMELRAGRVL